MKLFFPIPLLALLIFSAFGSWLLGSEPGQSAGTVSLQEKTKAASELPESDRRTSKQKLADLQKELGKKWPDNRSVRLVFHGHSVPAGYFKTPEVKRFDSYPTLSHQALCQNFPTAMIDVCVTAIGGEESDAGEKRFETDVLSLKPDVVFIDYGLNDRRIGLQRSELAWRSMIESSLKQDILVVLLTPTPDSREDILSETAGLLAHSKQIRKLASEFDIPIVDSYAAFQGLVKSGAKVESFLSQSNHPNRKGHEVVAELISMQVSK